MATLTGVNTVGSDPGAAPGAVRGAGLIVAAQGATALLVAMLLVVPGLMAFLSLMLPARFARWLNIGLALFYAAFVAITMPGAWWFYLAYSCIEITLCGVIAWLAWHWPRTA